MVQPDKNNKSEKGFRKSKERAGEDLTSQDFQKNLESLDKAMKKQAQQLADEIEGIIRRYGSERVLSPQEKENLLDLTALIWHKERDADKLIHGFASNLLRSSKEGKSAVKEKIRKAKETAREMAAVEAPPVTPEPLAEAAEQGEKTAELVQEIIGELRKTEINLQEFESRMAEISNLPNRQEKIKELGLLLGSYSQSRLAYYNVWAKYDVDSLLFERKGELTGEIEIGKLAPAIRPLGEYAKNDDQVRTRVDERIGTMFSKLEKEEQEEAATARKKEEEAAAARKKEEEAAEQKKKMAELVPQIIAEFEKCKIDVQDFNKKITEVSRLPDAQERIRELEKLRDFYSQALATFSDIWAKYDLDKILSEDRGRRPKDKEKLDPAIRPLADYVENEYQSRINVDGRIKAMLSRAEAEVATKQREQEAAAKQKEAEAAAEVADITREAARAALLSLQNALGDFSGAEDHLRKIKKPYNFSSERDALTKKMNALDDVLNETNVSDKIFDGTAGIKKNLPENLARVAKFYKAAMTELTKAHTKLSELENAEAEARKNPSVEPTSEHAGLEAKEFESGDQIFYVIKFSKGGYKRYSGTVENAGRKSVTVKCEDGKTREFRDNVAKFKDEAEADAYRIESSRKAMEERFTVGQDVILPAEAERSAKDGRKISAKEKREVTIISLDPVKEKIHVKPKSGAKEHDYPAFMEGIEFGEKEAPGAAPEATGSTEKTAAEKAVEKLEKLYASYKIDKLIFDEINGAEEREPSDSPDSSASFWAGSKEDQLEELFEAVKQIHEDAYEEYAVDVDDLSQDQQNQWKSRLSEITVLMGEIATQLDAIEKAKKAGAGTKKAGAKKKAGAPAGGDANPAEKFPIPAPQIKKKMRHLINQIKLGVKREGAGEGIDPEAIVKEASLADSEEVFANDELKNNLNELVTHWLESGNLDNDGAEIQRLADMMGFSPEEVKQLILGQEHMINELAQSSTDNGKNWKQKSLEIAKSAGKRIGAYAAIGIGLGIATGGTGWAIGLGIGGVRVLEKCILEKAYAKKREKNREQVREKIKSGPKSDERELLLKNIAAEIAFAKQAQIDGLPGMGKEKLLQFVVDNCGDNEPVVTEAIKKSIEAIMAVDQKREEMAVEAAKQTNLGKLASSIGGSRLFRLIAGEEETTDEKITNAAIFSAVGIIARSVPGVRVALLGLAGWRVGGVLAKGAEHLLGGEQKEYTAENMTSDDALMYSAINHLAELKASGASKKEIQKLQEQIDAAFSGKITRAEDAAKIMQAHTAELESAITRGRSQKFKKNVVNLGFRAGTAAAFAFFGYEFLNPSTAGAEEMPLMEGHATDISESAMPAQLRHISRADAEAFIGALKSSSGLADSDLEKAIGGVKMTDERRYDFFRNYLNAHDKSGTTARQFDLYVNRQNLSHAGEVAKGAGVSETVVPAAPGAADAGTEPVAPVPGAEHIETVGRPPAEIAPSAEQINSAIIRKGKGIEHSFINQFTSDPNLAKKFGWDSKDDLVKWAGVKAHQIAMKTGYVDAKTGAEVRVGSGGIDKVAYVLGGDKDNPSVREYFEGKPREMHAAGATFEGAAGEKLESYEYLKGATEAVKKAAGEAAEAGRAAAKEVAETVTGKEVIDGTSLIEQHSAAFDSLNHQMIVEAGGPGQTELAHYSVDLIDANKDGIPEHTIFRLGDSVISEEFYEPGQFADAAAFEKYTEQLGAEMATAGQHIDEVATRINDAGNRTLAFDFINNTLGTDINIDGFDYSGGIREGSAFERLIDHFNSHRDLFTGAGEKIDPTQFKVFKELTDLKADQGLIFNILGRTKMLDNGYWSMSQESAIAKLMVNSKINEAAGWIKELFGPNVATESVGATTTNNGITFSNVNGQTVAFNFNAGVIKVGKGLGAIFGGGKTFKLDQIGEVISELSSD